MKLPLYTCFFGPYNFLRIGALNALPKKKFFSISRPKYNSNFFKKEKEKEKEYMCKQNTCYWTNLLGMPQVDEEELSGNLEVYIWIFYKCTFGRLG